MRGPIMDPRVAEMLTALQDMHETQDEELKMCLGDLHAQQLAAHRLCVDAVLKRHRDMAESAEGRLKEWCFELCKPHGAAPVAKSLGDLSDPGPHFAGDPEVCESLGLTSASPTRHTNGRGSDESERAFFTSSTCGSLESTVTTTPMSRQEGEFKHRPSLLSVTSSARGGSRARIRESYNEAQQRQLKHRSLSTHCVEKFDSWAGDLNRKPPRFETLKMLVESLPFTMFSASIIILNAAFTGYEADVAMKSALVRYDKHVASGLGGAVPLMNDDPAWHIIVNTTFTALLSLELLMRILVYEWSFWMGPDRVWNCLDAILVMSSLVEAVFVTSGFNASYIRVLRLLRMIRTLRIVRVMRHFRVFRQLRVMMLAIMHSMIALMWAIVLLIIIIFLFGVIFILGAEDYVRGAIADDRLVWEIRQEFASMPRVLLTLFAIVTGGLNWSNTEFILRNISSFYGLLLLLYVSLMLLAMMNIVTGIFVNDAIESTQTDVDLQAQAELEKTNRTMNELKRLFREFDSDGSETITLEEFTEHLEDEGIKTMLGVLEIEVADAIAFFDVLDVDNTEELDIDEFVMGCIYLKGAAKMVNVATLMRENKLMMSQSMKQACKVEDRVTQLAEQIEHVLYGPEHLRNLGVGSQQNSIDQPYEMDPGMS
uniref:EF-hand domain-containing protein n=1 Tax=Noctiluca scintillans TaxID=2966 RepID=A0A7S1ASU5_NOCSC